MWVDKDHKRTNLYVAMMLNSHPHAFCAQHKSNAKSGKCRYGLQPNDLGWSFPNREHLVPYLKTSPLEWLNHYASW